MKKLKDELQNIIRRDGPIGGENVIKTWEEMKSQVSKIKKSSITINKKLK